MTVPVSISGSSSGSPYNLGSNGSYATTSSQNVIAGTDVTGDTVALAGGFGGNAITLAGAISGNTVYDFHVNGDPYGPDTITLNGWDHGSGNTVNASGSRATIDLSWGTGDTLNLTPLHYPALQGYNNVTFYGEVSGTVNDPGYANVITATGGSGNTFNDDAGASTENLNWGNHDTVTINGYSAYYDDTVNVTGGSHELVVDLSAQQSSAGDRIGIVGGSNNTVSAEGGFAKINLSWDQNDVVDLAAFGNIGATGYYKQSNIVTVTGGTGDGVNDVGSGNTITINGGSYNTIGESGAAAALDLNWDSDTTVTIGYYSTVPAQGAKLTAVGSSGVTVKDSSDYASITLDGVVQGTVQESGTYATVNLNFGSGNYVYASGTGNAVNVSAAVSTGIHDTDGNVSITGGTSNSVTITSGGTADAVSLAWDSNDGVLVSGTGAGNSVSVLGGSGDTVTDQGTADTAVTLNGGSGNTVNESGNGTVIENWATNGTFNDTGSGNSITLVGALTDSVADSGSGNTITLTGGSGTSISENGNYNEISLNWDQASAVTVSSGAQLVDFIGSANDSVTFGPGLAAGTNEFVNSAGYSLTQAPAQNPTGAIDTITVDAAGLNIYVWDYTDAQSEVETPTIVYGGAATAGNTTVTVVASMITASAAFAFDSSGGGTGVGSLDRRHESEALSLAPSHS